jgi:hypothetical protein
MVGMDYTRLYRTDLDPMATMSPLVESLFEQLVVNEGFTPLGVAVLDDIHPLRKPEEVPIVGLALSPDAHTLACFWLVEDRPLVSMTSITPSGHVIDTISVFREAGHPCCQPIEQLPPHEGWLREHLSAWPDATFRRHAKRLEDFPTVDLKPMSLQMLRRVHHLNLMEQVKDLVPSWLGWLQRILEFERIPAHLIAEDYAAK